MDLWMREARLFKYGSGTGTNFSALRGENEKLSGGGRSSGLMSFLKIGDRAAGAIKSGGTTRRAAKMVVVDVDHPDIEAFIDWKVKEEQKVAALVAGSKLVKRHLKAILKACVNCEGPGDDCFAIDKNPALKREVKLARRDDVPDGMIKRVIQFARQGYTNLEFDAYDTDWESEAYLTVSGQNSNNSVRVTDDFLHAVETDGEWNLTRRLDGKVAKTLKAARPVGEDRLRRLGLRRSRPAVPHHHQRLAHLPGIGADPRLQSVLGIHVPRRHGLQSRLAQPAAVPRPRDAQRSTSPPTSTRCRLWTLALEISVMMAQFPSKEIARLSYDYRTLGLGYANIGGLLMSCGIAYDSDEGRAICGALTAIMTGRAYATSAEIAAKLGAFPGYAPNAKAMLRVIRNHRRAADGLADGYEQLSVAPTPLDHASLDKAGAAWADLSAAARAAWADALALGEAARLPQRAGHGGRADRHDRPGDGLRHHRHRARLRPGQVQEARRRRLFQDHQPRRARGVARARLRRGEDRRDRRLRRRPRARSASRRASTAATLRAKGFTDAALAKVEAALAGAFDIRFVFNKWTLGDDFLTGTLKIPAEKLDEPGFDLLAALGFAKSRDRGRQRPRLRRDDARRRAAPEGRASAGVRLRQSLRPHRQALPLGRQPHPHDGGGAAVHLGRDLQDDQHAQRRDRRGLQGRLHAVLAARPQGQRALSRRLEAVAAARTRS